MPYSEKQKSWCEICGQQQIRKQSGHQLNKLLPVSYSDVAAIFEGYLFGVNLIAGVAVSPPTLGD